MSKRVYSHTVSETEFVALSVPQGIPTLNTLLEEKNANHSVDAKGEPILWEPSTWKLLEDHTMVVELVRSTTFYKDKDWSDDD